MPPDREITVKITVPYRDFKAETREETERRVVYFVSALTEPGGWRVRGGHDE